MTNDVKPIPSNHLTGSAVPEVVNRSHEEKTKDNNSIAATQGGPRERSVGRSVVILLIAVVVVGLLVLSGVIPRFRSRKALAAETNELAAPTDLVMQPKRGAPSQQIRLPGNIQSCLDAPMYASTNTYLERSYFDV